MSSELSELARRIAERAARDEQVEVTVARGRTTTVRVHGGEVESFTAATTHCAGVRVVVEQREGFAHAGSLEEDVLLEALAEARDNAGFATPDEYAGLAEHDGVEPATVNRWHDELLAYPDDARIERALDLERRVLGGDGRIRSVRTAAWYDSVTEMALCASTGVASSSRATSCSLSVAAIAAEGHDTSTGFGVDAARRPDDLDDARVAGDAIERATELLGGRPAPSQRIALLLEPRLAATLLGIVASTLTGEAVLKGRSPFGDRLGQAIAPSWLNLVDDPTDVRSIAADAHDGEGLATRRNVLIQDGVLAGFLYDARTGRRAGRRSTASAVRSPRSLPSPGVQVLAVSPGGKSPDELLASMETGVALRSMNGLHSGVNPVSGDFSVGAEGRMIRGGELAEPVREVTIAGSLQRMLAELRAVGSDLTWLPGGTGMSTVVVDGVSLGGR